MLDHLFVLLHGWYEDCFGVFLSKCEWLRGIFSVLCTCLTAAQDGESVSYQTTGSFDLFVDQLQHVEQQPHLEPFLWGIFQQRLDQWVDDELCQEVLEYLRQSVFTSLTPGARLMRSLMISKFLMI